MYTQGWFSHKINSNHFREPGHNNPDNQWPFHDTSIYARRLDMENIKLDLNEALDKLGQ